MKTQAAVLYSMKKPAPYAESHPLVIEELEVAGPGPGEVLVELAGAGLCHSDLSTINGTIPRRLPVVLGHEASGIVREVGPGVTDFQADDHVVFSFVPTCGHCLYCSIGRPALCINGAQTSLKGTLLNGSVHFSQSNQQPVYHYLGVSAFSRYTVVAQESLVKIEKNIPLEKASLFGCALITGVGAVINTAQVRAGEPVAIFGLGGVGLSVLMGARLVGAFPIIAIDVLPTKFELAKKLGADFTLSAHDTNLTTAIADLTGGGVEYAFEAVGNEQVLAQAYRVTRAGGKTICVGIPHSEKQVSLQVLSLVALEKTVQGSFMGSSVPRRDIPKLINLYKAGRLPVEELLSPSLRLNEINTGFDRLAQGQAIRQIINFH